MFSRAVRRVVPSAIVSSLFAAVLATAAPLANGAPVLNWHCVQEFDGAFHVRCTPHAAHQDPGAPVQGQVTDSGADLAVDARLPVAQRGDAEVYSADAWRVPLHVPPRDPRHVEALLQSVLCGTRMACTVRYAGARRQTALR